MKFLDKLIEESISKKIIIFTNKIISLEQDSILKDEKINLLNKQLHQSKQDSLLEIDSLRSDIRNINNKCSKNTEDLEIGLEGIIKIFNDKFETLGYKKSIVTDLLKKIAKLEVKDVSS